jgi:hypothetical protein
MERRPRSLLLVPLALALCSGRDPARAEGQGCSASALTVSVERLSESRPVLAHGTVVYAVVVTDARTAGCEPSTLLFRGNQPAVPGFSVFVVPTLAASAPGAKQRAVVSVTPTDARPGDYEIPFGILGAGEPQPRTKLPVHVDPPPACAVNPLRELFIRDPSVVDDPIRTSAGGAWTFRKLIEEASPEKSRAPAITRAFLETWLHEQRINSFSVAARPSMQTLVLGPWPKADDGALDLSRAKLRLLAIVGRIDLRDPREARAGELRFVFGLLGPAGHPMPFTMIFEYGIPAASPEDARKWAQRFHRLGALRFPSEEYNASLQAITDAVIKAGSAPGRTNGSALLAVRTNENALAPLWELREFRLSAHTGGLEPTSISGTPNAEHLDRPILADFINRNEASILAGEHEVPEVFRDHNFRAGASLNMAAAWRAPGIASPEARRQFSLHTCDGCHGANETGTEFVHVANREVGAASHLSGFLMGIALEDPVTGQLHTYNELGRRKLDLERLVCGMAAR